MKSQESSIFRAEREQRRESLEKLLRERIVILDGPRGTMIQKLGLSEDQFRGERFRDFSRPLKGNNDILNLTLPERIEKYTANSSRLGRTSREQTLSTQTPSRSPTTGRRSYAVS
jgi:hypothetical protein